MNGFETGPRSSTKSQCVRRVKGIGHYSTYHRIIEGRRLVAAELGCLLIEVEQLWIAEPDH